MRQVKIDGVASIRAEFGTDALIAIRREHADRILSGEKLYELRRVCPRTVPRRLYLWVTGKGGGIVGQVVVSKILFGDPDSLWKRVGERATTKERFDHYFSSDTTGCAIEIEYVVEFPRLMTLDEIRGSWARAAVPRNFVYLDPEGDLSKKLESLTFNCTFIQEKAQVGISIRPIKEIEYDDFRKQVVEHIGSAYLETGEKYADHLIEEHERGFDAEGVFTARKWVCAIESDGDLIGFTVLTAKMGGAVKTGPTMIDATRRNQGMGVEVRHAIHAKVARLGYRKVYCTAPVIRPGAVQYLLSAGYRVEADLDRQYHYSHRELVLGWVISESDRCVQRCGRVESVYVRIHRVRTKSCARECVDVLRQTFGEVYCRVSQYWALRQLEKAVPRQREQGYSKPVSIYKADDVDGVAGLVLCVWKRGGAVKLCPIILRGADGDVAALLRYAIDGLRRQKNHELRKIYTHIMPEDEQLVRTVQNIGFDIEGCIRRPYRSNQDMLVLAKMMG